MALLRRAAPAPAPNPSEDSGPVVDLSSVVCLSGRYPVLAGVDLTVRQGEVVALTGANGAGKTSLLRLLAGLLGVHEGSAVVLGRDLRTDRRSLRHDVAFSGHQPFLYDELTVEENVRFLARASGARSFDLEAVLQRAGLEARLASVRAAQLSAGQRRRTGLAVLLARDVRLWLLDEPHSGLDSATRDLLNEAVLEAAEDGTAVIFSSHEQEMVQRLDARRVTVEGGMTMDGAHVS